VTTVADTSYLDRLLALVGAQDTLDALEESGRRVEVVVRRLGAARLRDPWGPGKWTGGQVLAHLADSELVQGFRSRQILTEQPHTVQEYDESAWISLYGDGIGIDTDAALATFVAARRWNLRLFRGLTPAQLARAGFHPKRGPEPLATTLRAVAGHTYNHLAQLEKM
jgi:hypothetical protein